MDYSAFNSMYDRLLAGMAPRDWKAVSHALSWLACVDPELGEDLLTSNPRYVEVVQSLVSNEEVMKAEGANELIPELLDAIRCLREPTKEQTINTLIATLLRGCNAQTLYHVGDFLAGDRSTAHLVFRLGPLCANPIRLVALEALAQVAQAFDASPETTPSSLMQWVDIATKHSHSDVQAEAIKVQQLLRANRDESAGGM